MGHLRVDEGMTRDEAGGTQQSRHGHPQQSPARWSAGCCTLVELRFHPLLYRCALVLAASFWLHLRALHGKRSFGGGVCVPAYPQPPPAYFPPAPTLKRCQQGAAGRRRRRRRNSRICDFVIARPHTPAGSWDAPGLVICVSPQTQFNRTVAETEPPLETSGHHPAAHPPPAPAHDTLHPGPKRAEKRGSSHTSHVPTAQFCTVQYQNQQCHRELNSLSCTSLSETLPKNPIACAMQALKISGYGCPSLCDPAGHWGD